MFNISQCAHKCQQFCGRALWLCTHQPAAGLRKCDIGWVSIVIALQVGSNRIEGVSRLTITSDDNIQLCLALFCKRVERIHRLGKHVAIPHCNGEQLTTRNLT